MNTRRETKTPIDDGAILTEADRVELLTAVYAPASRGVCAVVERIIAERVVAGQAEVANAYVQWATKNEAAAPPLDWAWFGEISRRYSPLHEEYVIPPGGRGA